MTDASSLQFLTEDRVPAGPGDLVAQEAWFGRLVAALVLLGAGVAVPIVVYQGVLYSSPLRFEFSFEAAIGLIGYGIGGLMALVMTLVGLLGGWGFLTNAMAAWRRSNWTLRAGPDGLYLKLRGYTDFRLAADDEIVAFIPRRQVRWLRLHDERARRIGNRDAEERRRWVSTFLPGVTMKAKGIALTVREPDLLRLDWRTKRTVLVPKLSTARGSLARHYRFAEDVEAEQVPLQALDRAAQESRLLEMVRHGNAIDATILAQGLYGFTTTEAKKFLEELEGE